MSDDPQKPSWMNIQEPASASGGGQLPPPAAPQTSPPSGGRSDQRRKRNLLLGVGGAVVAVGAVIAIVLAASGSRSGTLTGASGASGATDTTAVATTSSVPSTSAIIGDAAAELLAKIPAKSISAGSVQLGPNVAITSMTVSKNPDGSFSGSGTITIGGTVGLSVSATITDATHWTLTAASSGTSPFKIGSTGITVDPSTISGTISDNGGAIAWNLVGNTVTWPIASGASLTTNFSIGSTCPFSDTSKCPSGNNVYLGLPSGSLAISGLPTVSLAGGVTIDGSWARLEGTANASASLSVAGASVSMSSPSLTVWRGARSDSYDPNMVMPDTSTLSNGTNLELCGNFAVTIPSLVNQATGGCVRWTPSGIVLGQVGLGSGMTLSGGTAPSGTTADIKGIGWSSISAANLAKISLPNGGAAGSISFSGVSTKLIPSALSLGGKANLPGVVASALGQTSLPAINVTGQITSNSIALQGTVPVTISIGTEPFKVNVQSMTLALAAGGGNGFSMTLGTQSDVELGYGNSKRVVTSSITLQAATAPAPGFTLSLSAIGKPGNGETQDGLTPNTRLTLPSTATYLVPDMMGIGGLNLWSLTGQIGWQDGSPSLAYYSTTYMDPNGSATKNVMKCTGTCDDVDWLQGTLAFDLSYTNPCFAYGFTSNPSGGSLAIDGGVLSASNFQIGFAPNSCSINVAGKTKTLPAGFAGFAFSATFGTATVDVATQVSTNGFTFSSSLGNITLAGVLYKNLSLNVSITGSASSTSFDAVWTAGKLGDSNVHADMSIDSQGLAANISGNIPSFTTRVVGTFELSNFTFSGSAGLGGSCGYMNSNAAGSLAMKGATYTLNKAVLNLDCNGLQAFAFDISFTHGGTSSAMSFSYNKSTLILTGSFAYSKSVSFSKKPCSICYTYSGSGSGTLYMYLDVDLNANSGSFRFGGKVHGHGTSHALVWDFDTYFKTSVTWSSGSTDFSGTLGFDVSCGAYDWSFSASA